MRHAHKTMEIDDDGWMNGWMNGWDDDHEREYSTQNNPQSNNDKIQQILFNLIYYIDDRCVEYHHHHPKY